MGVFEQTQIAVADGVWAVRVKQTADLMEYITHEDAVRLADDLDAEGWRECAAQVRKAVCKALAALHLPLNPANLAGRAGEEKTKVPRPWLATKPISAA
jgi:hypothetical protein